MSSAKKQIVIDSGVLSVSNNHTMKRQRKMKPPPALLRPNDVKRNLLDKLKEYQRRNEETPSSGSNINNHNNHNNHNNNQTNQTNQDLANQFKMSTNYLEQLINKKKEGRKHNKSKQTHQQMLQQPPQQINQEISLELPPELQINPMQTQAFMQPHVQPQAFMQPQVVPQAFMQPQVVPQSFMQPQVVPHAVMQPQSFVQPQVVPQASAYNPIVLKDVPYGCLRGGNKPTYRTYHRGIREENATTHNHNHTLKRSLFSQNATNPIIATNPEDPMILERQRKLREIQENHQAQIANNNNNNNNNNDNNNNNNNNNDNNDNPDANVNDPNEPNEDQCQAPTQIRNKIKQTITKKYKLGKTPGGNVVGVLIKNNDTRRRVQEEHGVLRRESIVEIRKYLHARGLIKVGSDAPPDVLRNIYESAKLTGEISNTNKHVMLHNFMKAEDEHA